MTLVEIQPAWRGYMYFVYEDEIIIVEPRTLQDRRGAGSLTRFVEARLEEGGLKRPPSFYPFPFSAISAITGR